MLCIPISLPGITRAPCLTCARHCKTHVEAAKHASCFDRLSPVRRYVAAWKPDEYAFVYYKGNNDAWRGYGGATVYTRAPSFPKEYDGDMRKAAEVRVTI